MLKEEFTVTELPNGLRFDIYERVHLPDEVAAIEELEEIELVPHMRVLPQDDSVLLSGHLLLSGVYRAQQSQDLAQLEHWIPVEITLPLNRVNSVDDLGVEIDNFDVDVLSTRSLNVTGVLALRGLQVAAAQVPIWKDDSFTVVHQAQPGYEADFERDGLSEPDLPPAEASFDEAYTGAGDFYVQDDEPERVEELAQALPQVSDNDDWLAKFKLEEQPQAQERAASPAAAYPSAAWNDVSVRQAAEPPASRSASEAPAPPPSAVPVSAPEPAAEQAAVQPESPRINLTVADAAARAQSGVGLLSQLGDIGAKRESELKQLEAALAEEKAAAANNASQTSSGDELEWTRLFLNGAGEAQSFRKVRMCIVQRDDTLEGIADRYNVQPRTLQLHNRLNDPYLSEGQVLYIP